MKSVLFLAAASGLAANAQTTPPPATTMEGILAGMGIDMNTCTNDTIPTNIDPMVQFKGGNVKWPCDFGKPVPFGKIPTGCAKFEVLVGEL
jgi:hypothetical protein